MDIKASLACVLLVGGAIGMFFPGGDEQPALANEQSDEGADERPNARSDPARESSFSPSQTSADRGWGDNVVLERESDGHFYAEVTVDGYPFRMLVDTGASVVALTAQDAEAMGLTWFEDEVQPVARGAGGVINGVHATIKRMSVGGHEATGVSAVIIPDGASISLLGQSFLSTIGSMEISGDQMVLGN